MNNHFAAGILAGLASALFASSLVAAPATFANILIYFAPLPILVVSLCWRHQAGLVATAVGALALLLPTLSVAAGLFMLLGIGLPAWGLAYLVLLGRNSGNGMEWYPPGNILVWVTGIATVLTAVLLFTLSEGSYEQYMRIAKEMADFLEPQFQAAMPGVYTHEMLVSFARALLPTGQGAWITLMLILNLWIAARMAVRMKRMPRPWPFIPATRMPPVILALAAVSFALVFLDGFPGLIGLGMRSAILTVLLLQGLMFIHFITRGHALRNPVLIIVYLAIPLAMTIGQGMLLYGLVGLGAADVLFNIRKKPGANGSPPANIPN